ETQPDQENAHGRDKLAARRRLHSKTMAFSTMALHLGIDDAVKMFGAIDNSSARQRMVMKDQLQVMEDVATHEDWKICFAEAAPGLVLFARQFVRTSADAEDIVQEAFVRFWRKQHSIQNRALLFATVRSISLDLLRRDARRARREATAVADSDHEVAPQFESGSDTQRLLVREMDRLPAEQREVLVMKIWNELTFADIGNVLGISQNTAASRYRYALGALKKNLTHERLH
ncbi:MAG: RNA polymerase sigma factor, partial [Chthoniobacterales bacterium]